MNHAKTPASAASPPEDRPPKAKGQGRNLSRSAVTVNPAAGGGERPRIAAAGGMRAGALEATTARDGRILTARTADSMLPDS